MIKGKILSIGHDYNKAQWTIKIDRVEKVFHDWSEAEAWIKLVIDKGQDPAKVELLRKDCRRLF